jgi:hypothetical protein
LTIEKGKPLTLVYGVAVWDGQADNTQISKLYQAWQRHNASVPQ